MCNTVLYARYNISTIFHKKKIYFFFTTNNLIITGNRPILILKKLSNLIDWIASLVTYVFYFYIELLHFFI